MICCKLHPDAGTIIRAKGPHIGVYCKQCGKWIKWVQKSEKVLQVMSNVDVVIHKSEPRPIKVVFDKDNDVPWD